MDPSVLEKCREELQRQTDELLVGAGKTVSDMTSVTEVRLLPVAARLL